MPIVAIAAIGALGVALTSSTSRADEPKAAAARTPALRVVDIRYERAEALEQAAARFSVHVELSAFGAGRPVSMTTARDPRYSLRVDGFDLHVGGQDASVPLFDAGAIRVYVGPPLVGTRSTYDAAFRAQLIEDEGSAPQRPGISVHWSASARAGFDF